jgi:hypothetical protein
MCACVKLLTIIIVVWLHQFVMSILYFCGFSFAYVNLNEWICQMCQMQFWWFFPSHSNEFACMNMIFNIQEAQTAIKGAQSARHKWQWNKINSHFGPCFCCWCNSQFSHLKWNHQHWCAWFLHAEWEKLHFQRRIYTFWQ